MGLENYSNIIKQEALRLGFDACGIAKADFLEEEAKALQSWLDKGYHAELGYMANHFEKRTDPRLLVENCKSVIVVLLNYFPKEKQNEDIPQIAYYAYGKDYHTIIKNKLHELLKHIQNLTLEQPVNGRVFTDSAPVLERAWAYKAGLGRIGKNTHLINNKIGSFCFIGEIILDLELEYDNPVKTGCGTCKRCIEACPTKALREPFVLDCNRCLSYHNIESKESIPADIARNLSNKLYGCDICQQVCPSNRGIPPRLCDELKPIPRLIEMSLDDWNRLSEEEFNLRFKDSPLKRAGYAKIKNNLDFLGKKGIKEIKNFLK